MKLVWGQRIGRGMSWEILLHHLKIYPHQPYSINTLEKAENLALNICMRVYCTSYFTIFEQSDPQTMM
jgi:hypothetical protein